MVFKMVTLDLRRSIEEDFGGPSESPPSSPPSSTTLCCSATFAVAATAASTLDVTRLYRRRGFHLPKVEQSEVELLVEPGSLTIFTFEELQLATNKFSKENMIGTGGFGKVYKGTLPNGYVVAVKRHYDSTSTQLPSDFQAEVKVGKMPNHRNVLPLLGFCAKPKKFCLVYPYMANLSFRQCLTEGSLKWRTRMKIAIGAARGIAHLHSLNIIHRDIKPANIMLDERFDPLIGDFGIAFFSKGYASNMAISHNNNLPISSQKATSSDSETDYETRLIGTYGYMPPEYALSGACSKKVDVYCFGVTLLELITGERAVQGRFETDEYYLLETGEYYLLDRVTTLLREGRWERLIDKNMELEDYEESEVELVLIIALLCAQSDPRKRPTMIQVVQFLQGNGIDERWQHQMDKILQTSEIDKNKHMQPLEWDDDTIHLSEILSGPR